MSSYGVKLPLTYDSGNGFAMLKKLKNVIKQNLKMLFLTSPGEYVMDAGFGVGLYNYLFELPTQQTIQTIKPTIYDQVSKYMPYVHIKEIILDFTSIDSNALRVSMRYRTSQSELDELFNLVVTS